VAGIPAGSTIPNIVAARPIVTVAPRTNLEALRAEIHWPTVKRVRGSRSAGKAAIWQAVALVAEPGLAIAPT